MTEFDFDRYDDTQHDADGRSPAELGYEPLLAMAVGHELFIPMPDGRHLVMGESGVRFEGAPA